MHIYIDSHDYTSALDASIPLIVERTLNAPSHCCFAITLGAGSALPSPVRMQSVSIVGQDDTTYFTGYIVATPAPEYVGLAIDGRRYRLLLECVSDEVLLDQVLMDSMKSAGGESASAAINNLVMRTGVLSLSTKALILGAPIGTFTSGSGLRWSESAGSIAGQARAAYRAQNGTLALAPIPSAVHALREDDGSFNPAQLALSTRGKRGTAGDVTVCGQHEPAAYVTEYFQGDGATTQFYLSAAPFFDAASESELITELFNQATIDAAHWSNGGGPNYFWIGAGGLTMGGGNGLDGQTTLVWRDSIEMGGTLLLEASGVTLQAASTGILAGFYGSSQDLDACTAGFQAITQQGSGAVSLQPVVYGCASGAVYATDPAHQYTLRLRVYCPEMERVRPMYRSWCDSGAVSAGGQMISAPAKLHFEIQQYVNGVATMPVTLYDGAIVGLPAWCFLTAASSLNLHGSMRALRLRKLGSGWVESTPAGGGPRTRRIGSLEESAECVVERGGKLVFYPGFAPAAGEQIAVCYRSTGRAVGRAVQAASGNSPAWIGTVRRPQARSSADCRNAAAALVQAASCNTALWSCVYRATQIDLAEDVWPGDALAIDAPSCDVHAQMVVRAVKLTFRPAIPELIEYEVAAANDWAEDLAVTVSEDVPADTWLPAPVAAAYAANLTALTVTALTGSSVTIHTGQAPPAGGGFEVRRRDFVFMPGEDADLVMRGAEQNMTWSRQSACERFYVRIFDGATPPNYSEFSAAIFINLPLDL